MGNKGRKDASRPGTEIAARRTVVLRAVCVSVCAAALIAAVDNWRDRPGDVASAGTRAAVPPARASAPADSGGGAEAASNVASTPYSGLGRVGDPAPDLELVSLDGHRVSLSSLRGRAVLLNLWATWCAPCLHEMPELTALHRQYVDEGLAVVGVNVENAVDRVRAFVAERDIPFAVWLDPEMQTPKTLRVTGLPATFLLDGDGRIVLRRNGPITAADPELREALERVGNSPPSPRARVPTIRQTAAARDRGSARRGRGHT